MNLKLFIIVIFIYVAWASIHNAPSNSPDTGGPHGHLTPGKQWILSKFRAILEEHWPWKNSFDDQLLLRFLKAKDFNAVEAFHALKDHLIWRKAFNVDNILDEDWSDMEEHFPYDVLVSFPNRKQDPVVSLQIHLGQWDILGDLELSTSERYIRYATAKMMEDADRKARSWASADKDPKFNVIVNFEGLKVNIDESVGVVSELRNIIQLLADQWKEATDKFVFINAPHVPDFLCTWSTEGELACPNIYSVKVDNHKFNLRGVEF